MPLKSGEFTQKEARLIAEYVDHHDIEKAERAAGYSPGMGRVVLRKPAILDAVREEVDARILELSDLSTRWMRDAFLGRLPADEQRAVTVTTKHKIAETALKYLYGPKAAPTSPDEPPVIPYEQLSGIIDKLKAKEAELSQGMVDVTPAADDVGDLFG